MALRPRGILDERISEEQSAFVSGCLITDNVLISYECIDYVRKKKRDKGACAIKLDMIEAFDQVERKLSPLSNEGTGILRQVD
jgi:hypothetical protein